MRLLILVALSLAGCATPQHADKEHVVGVAHTSCGAAEGGALHMALDAGSDFVLIWADGSWGEGPSWSFDSSSPTNGFSVRVCGSSGGECQTTERARLMIESSNRSSILGTLAYETTSTKRQYAFRALRTGQSKQFALCG